MDETAEKRVFYSSKDKSIKSPKKTANFKCFKVSFKSRTVEDFLPKMMNF